jgi:hypothetical protein
MGDYPIGAGGCNRFGNNEAIGLGGDAWYMYRFADCGGDAISLRSLGIGRCGTLGVGWLSGWNASDPHVGPTRNPPEDYAAPGRYPTLSDGVIDARVCVDDWLAPCNGGRPRIQVVQCVGFLLLRLPFMDHCDHACCTDLFQNDCSIHVEPSSASVNINGLLRLEYNYGLLSSQFCGHSTIKPDHGVRLRLSS